MKRNRSEKGELRVFGFGLAGFLAVISGLQIHGGNNGRAVALFGASLAALTLSLAYPYALRYIYKVMMAAAHAIGWVNTRILLGVIFYLIISPVGIFLKIIRRDLLNRKIDKSLDSYWKKREAAAIGGMDRYKRQF